MTNILVEISTEIIKHQGWDYSVEDDKVKCEKPGENIIYFPNADQYEFRELDNSIENFIGNKFLYQNNEVIINPDYIEPS